MNLYAWLSQQDARSVATTVGIVAGALVTMVAAVRLPVVNRPVRYCWSHLIGQPVGQWFRGLIREEVTTVLHPIVMELRTNGGSSARDRLDAIAHAVGAPPAPEHPSPAETAEETFED